MLVRLGWAVRGRRAAGTGPADGPSVSSGKYCSSTAMLRNVYTSVDAFVDGRFIVAFTRALKFLKIFLPSWEESMESRNFQAT